MNSDIIVSEKVPSGKDLFDIETSQLTCSSDQLAGFRWCRFLKKEIFK